MDPTIVAAIIAAAAGALVGFGSSWLTARSQRKATEAALNRQIQASKEAQSREARVLFRRRQLTELYGPMYFERRRSERLRAQLPEWHETPDGRRVRWRLVDHIAETKANPDLRRICVGILASGDKVSELLMGLGGLLEPFPPPSAFQDFVLHHEMLKLSWEKGADQDPDRRFPFPGRSPSDPPREGCTEADAAIDLDCAIWLGMSIVKRDLEILLGVPVGSLTWDVPGASASE